MKKRKTFITDIDRHVATQIFKLRKSHGLSYENIASKIGVSQQQCSKYEKAINKIPLDRLVLIAGIFKKPTSYFFEDIDLYKDTLETQAKNGGIDRDFMRIKNKELKYALTTLIKALSIRAE